MPKPDTSSFVAASLAVALSCAAASAQFVTVAPNPSAQNQALNLTVTETAGSPLQLSSPCGWYRVRAGSPSGRLVATNAFCPQIIVNVAPNGSYTNQWDQIDAATGRPVPPGRYWIESAVILSNGTVQRDWTSVDIVPSATPVRSVVQLAPAVVGQPLPLRVFAANHPNESYALFLGFSQNNPIIAPGFLELSLSDPLFLLESGTLDAAGTSSTFNILIDNNPTLAFVGFHVQAVIVDSAFTLNTTNALGVLIQ